MELLNPYCKCLHPKRIVNPYTHEVMIVSCGTCEACNLAKNSRYAFQCELESMCSKYVLFVTLTYSDRFIPRANIVDNFTRPFGLDLVDKDTGEILCDCDAYSKDINALLKKFNMFGDIPYLRKYDLQLFLKRLRYYVSKKLPSEKVRYFACGEYGAVHFRPHYHLLLFLNSDQALSVCEQSVPEAWRFGRVDVQLSEGQCSSYVAGYVNSGMSLPPFFKTRAVCPFCIHSQKLGQGFLQGERAKVYSVPVDTFIKRSAVFDGRYKEFAVWRSAYAYYFPKCKGFAVKSTRERSYSYRVYEIARRLFPESTTTIDLARSVAYYIYYFHGDAKSYMLDLFGSVDLLDLQRLDAYFYEPDLFLLSVDCPDMDRYINRIYTELLVSKHFLYFVCDSPTLSEQKRKLKLIEDFYSRIDYLNLTYFFDSQKKIFESDLIGDADLLSDRWENSYYPYFYCNLHVSFVEYQQTPVYRLFSERVHNLFYDRIKHKKLNDANKLLFDY